MNRENLLFYYYTHNGYLVFEYEDKDGIRAEHSYMGYSFREALSLFRKKFGLKYVRMRKIKLY